MTPTAAFDVAVKKYGVRGLARLAKVSPTFVSRIKSRKQVMPTTGKLAAYLGIESKTTVRVVKP